MIRSLTSAVTAVRNRYNALLPLILCGALCCFFILYYSGPIGKILVSGNLPSAAWRYFSTITGLIDFSLRALLINCAVLLSCLLAELYLLGWEKSSLRRLTSARTGSARGDLWCWALSALYLYRLFVLVFSFGFFYVLSSYLVKHFHLNLLHFVISPFWQFLIILLLSDLKHYIRHFICHKVGFLWELHKYHHSADEMNMITAERGHFLEAGFISLFDTLLFILLGAPMELFIPLEVVRQVHILFTHSAVSWDLGFVGKYILVSPKAHVIHHSSSEEHHDRNFGNLFIFWDRLFNTWYDPKKAAAPVTIGLADNPYNKKGFFADQLAGCKAFWDRLFSVRNP